MKRKKTTHTNIVHKSAAAVTSPTRSHGFGVGVITRIQSEWDLLNGKNRKYSAALSKIFHHDIDQTQALVRSYQNKFEHMSVHHGEKYAIKRMKVYLSCAERFASHVKFTPPEYTTLDGDSLPKFLWAFKPLLTNKVPAKRQLALTILSLGRIYDCGVETYDVSSVVKTHPLNLHKSKYVGHFFRKSQHDELNVHRFGVSWRKVLREIFPQNGLRGRRKDLKNLTELHVTGRNGPNGHSLSSAYRDMIALLADEEMGGTLLSDIENLAKLVGHDGLLEHISEFRTDKKFQRVMRDEVSSGIPHFHSVINLKKGEPWWKERIFAAIDFFSQSSLIPIQKYLDRTMDNFAWAFDGSKDQSKVIEECRKWTIKLFPYSKDLTTATDSIPIELLTEVVIAIFGVEIGRAWQKVMSDRSFYDKVNNCYVKYVTGNPMGAYTSWHLLHLFQCILYLTIEDYLGLPSSSSSISPNFVVVGDDSSTSDREISKIYDIVMSELFEVSQSPLKGYNPDVSELESFKVCELCKRILVNGVDISPISPRVLLDGIRESSLFPNMMLHITERCKFITDINKMSAELSVITDQPLKTIKVIANPLISPRGFNPDWFARQDMKDVVELINSIEYDQFHLIYAIHALDEVHRKKLSMQSWITDTFLDVFDPESYHKFFPSSLTQVHMECQLGLVEAVLGQLTAMLINMDEFIFPIGYRQTIDNSPVGVRSQIIKKMIQLLIELDNFPSYLGYGHNRRDEKGEKFAAEFTKLGLKTFTSISDGVRIPIEYTPDVLATLESILSIPVLTYSEEQGLAVLSSVSFGHITTLSAETPRGS